MSVQRFGRVEVYTVERRVVVDGAPVVLGARAMDVLLVLIAREGGLATKNELLDAVWPGMVVEENNVAAQVTALRKALGSDAIATIPGYGYRFALASDAEKPASSPRLLAKRTATNIPPSSEQLIGRDADLRVVRELLGEYRIVTLVGPGGIGKSRLAQEVAREVAGDYADGAWWVDLAAISEPQRIVATIADAAGVKLASADREILCVALADRQMLLVLDNCEHLVDHVEPIAAALARIAGVRVLATSQAPLKCSAEVLHRLDSLAAPVSGVSLEAARALPAIALLERRARAVDRRFAVTDANLAEIVELCRQLDGMPLAIEMAAARLPILGAAHLGKQLRRSPTMLRNRSDDVPARHRVMKDTLDWSYSLLGPREQRMFRRLAVFVGTFTLEAVHAVADDDPTAAVDDFASLVDRSLVQVVGGHVPRYRLLETMRLYGREKLAESGESADAEARHRAAMLARAHEAMERTRSSSEAWFSNFISDYDDLELGFDRACARDDVDAAATFCTALSALDSARLSPLRARGRKEAALRLLPLSHGRTRALLLNILTSFRQIRLPGLSSRDLAAEGLIAWREQRDQHGLVVALCRLAVEAAAHGDDAVYDSALHELAAVGSASEPRDIRQRSVQLAFGAWILGRAAQIREHVRVLEELSVRLGEPLASMESIFFRARAEIIDGDPERAIALLRELIQELERPAGRDTPELARSIQWRSNAMMTLVAMLLHVGRLEEARATATRALPLALQTGYLIWLLDHAALCAAVTKQYATAARILGYTGARYAEMGEIRAPSESRSAARAREILDSALAPEELEQVLASGASRGESDIVRIASSLLDAPAPAKPAAVGAVTA